MWEDENQICADLWKRGQKTTQPSIRTVSRKQIEKAADRFMLREDRIGPSVGEMTMADTDQWEISSTAENDRFIILRRETR